MKPSLSLKNSIFPPIRYPPAGALGPGGCRFRASSPPPSGSWSASSAPRTPSLPVIGRGRAAAPAGRTSAPAASAANAHHPALQLVAFGYIWLHLDEFSRRLNFYQVEGRVSEVDFSQSRGLSGQESRAKR
eukprot:1033226-Prorocentrum_minimum.AAC.1